MCILQGETCPIIFKGDVVPGLGFFFKKYFVVATPPRLLGDFDETWYNVPRRIPMWRCAYHIFIGVKDPGLGIFFEKSLFSQLLLNPLEDFDETWYKERSHYGYVDVHFERGALSNNFSRRYCPWTLPFL
jgi:hypothetical protein